MILQASEWRALAAFAGRAYPSVSIDPPNGRAFATDGHSLLIRQVDAWREDSSDCDHASVTDVTRKLKHSAMVSSDRFKPSGRERPNIIRWLETQHDNDRPALPAGIDAKLFMRLSLLEDACRSDEDRVRIRKERRKDRTYHKPFILRLLSLGPLDPWHWHMPGQACDWHAYLMSIRY